MRGAAGVARIVVGAVLRLAGTLAFYAREHVVDREAFANRAVEALDDEALRRVVGREIVVQLAGRGAPDLAQAHILAATATRVRATASVEEMLTHSSAAWAPSPAGPNITVGIPAAAMNAASAQ